MGGLKDKLWVNQYRSRLTQGNYLFPEAGESDRNRSQSHQSLFPNQEHNARSFLLQRISDNSSSDPDHPMNGSFQVWSRHSHSLFFFCYKHIITGIWAWKCQVSIGVMISDQMRGGFALKGGSPESFSRKLLLPGRSCLSRCCCCCWMFL